MKLLSENTQQDMDRRSFLKRSRDMSLVLGAGLIVGVPWEAELLAQGGKASGSNSSERLDTTLISEAKAVEFGSWIRISPLGKVHLILDRVEMGQGTYTSHAMMVAEELEVNPEDVVVEFAPGLGGAFKNPAMGVQLTGGSTSVASSWKPLRTAAATAREMLRAAAAKHWGIKPAEVAVENGYLIRKQIGASAASGADRLPYSDFVLQAQSMRVKDVSLKKNSEFKTLGKSTPRLDCLPKVTGKAVYGLDVSFPGLLNCHILRCPVAGGKLKSFDGTGAKAVAGVVEVLALPSGVAVVAKHWYQAKKATALIKAEWDFGPLGSLNSAQVEEALQAGLKEKGKEVKSVGDMDRVSQKAIGETVVTVEGEYDAPFLAHATLEPQNATAYVTDDRCEIWAPTQGPEMARQTAAEILNIPHASITVHQTFLGGGFGRRIPQDYVADAVRVSAQLRKPVKVIWSREDDTQHDFYRPIFKVKFKATLDASRRALGLEAKLASPSILQQAVPDFLASVLPPWVPEFLKKGAGSLASSAFKGLVPDDTSTEGLATSAYEIPNVLVHYVRVDSGVPVGFWRAVGHSANGFFMEGIVSEMAFAAKADPLEFRRQLLSKSKKHLAVLNLLEEKSKWQEATPTGLHKGIAICESFNSVVGHVVHVEVVEGSIKVKKVFSAVHCGFAVNPDVVKSQVESSIVFGLGAALKQKITFSEGRVEQSNFHNYEMIRMVECPAIEVHIVQTDEDPTGIGEPGLPPIAPAVAEAVFVATGKRLRSLPLTLA